MARIWPVLLWTLGLSAGLAGPVAAQNLDAGKPPSQIFAEACAGCHRSVRDFKNGVSASFLREHYTTGSDMASTMAAYLTGVHTEPPRSSPPPRPSGTTAAREPASTGRPQQTSEPKAAQPKGTRPGIARVEAPKPAAAAEAKPPAPVPPPVPVEEFEE